MVVTLGQQYNVGEKPTVILYYWVSAKVHPIIKVENTKPGDVVKLATTFRIDSFQGRVRAIMGRGSEL